MFPGNQTDPHISDNRVTYTDSSFNAGTIPYYNLLTGIDMSGGRSTP